MIIREAKLTDAAAIAFVHYDSWQTTYRGLLPDDYIDKRLYEKHKNHWENSLGKSTEKETNYVTYVAENPDREIAGFIDGGLERSNNSSYQGEIYALYILEDYQRQGIGRNLVQQTASQLSQSDLTSILVWVLKDNSAVKFYQTLGFQEVIVKKIALILNKL
ncbi:GNAT family N-acetyltransferase [Pleurocapsa sp. FMAR1]|uniref:GNAT family N-acetyltransferase n=1 Tax=Pleurocapsa sp. FMAR1 TaxID=3040204 RepID=UPI0029C8C696|nr:GNAT family N-acetyltransferase [Pleurocapsa sp. FMAR1]